jgi:hypothetical protein
MIIFGVGIAGWLIWTVIGSIFAAIVFWWNERKK